MACPAGLPVEEIQRGIQHGVREIDVETDNRMAVIDPIRRVFSEKSGEFDPRTYMGLAREAMVGVCKACMLAFGQTRNAGRIKSVTCREMVDFHKT